MNDNDLKQLWKSQPLPTVAFSIDDLKKGARRFQRQVAWRNAIEYLASVCVIFVFGCYVVAYPSPLMRLGSILTIVGALVMAWQLRRRASSQPTPIEAGERPWRAFERQQLSRQRDALRLAWLWYVLPLAPGVTVFRWGVETELAASAPFLKGWAVNLAIALVFVVIAATNYFAARGLQRRIDQLDQETV